jgi:hypothetical protein
MKATLRLSEFEKLVLLALLRLGETYGVPIRREIVERADRDVSFGPCTPPSIVWSGRDTCLLTEEIPRPSAAAGQNGTFGSRRLGNGR